MNRKDFTRTAPVFADRTIQIVIDQHNPLDVQLKMITGDGWTVPEWTDTLKTGEITHIASGLRVRIMPPIESAEWHLRALLSPEHFTGVNPLRTAAAMNPNSVEACIKAKRDDLIAALDHGWHIANLAEPEKMADGTVIGNSEAAAELERICHS